MKYENFSLLTAFIIGLVGNIHCLGMCSGIILLLSLNLSENKKNEKLLYQIYYNTGRIIGYLIINVIAFTLGIIIIKTLGIENTKFLKLISGITLILISTYLISSINLIKKFEQFGSKIWIQIKKITKIIIPVKNPIQAIILGILWANIPCGLVYSTLIWSISSGSIVKSLTLMILFGLGTLPSMLGLGFISTKTKKIVNSKFFKIVSFFILISLGFFNIYEYFNNENCH